jgi:uncharacterized flavoprotein (TIGR03862 family)
MERKQIIIVGGGPAGLMAADVLSATCSVRLYDKEKNVGQKFLVAGKGGFNLTNGLQGDALLGKYSPAGFMDKALLASDTVAVRQWLSAMGVPTYTGSSGRVFPEKDIRPIDVLNKIKEKLTRQGVEIYTGHAFVGFDDRRNITFRHGEREMVLSADYILFALGGASWPVTGSNGVWKAAFETMGIGTVAFQSSNCGVNIRWPDALAQNHAGKPLKNIRLFTHDKEELGEAIITHYGMEGNAVYPVVPSLRATLRNHGEATLCIDFKLGNTVEQLLQKINGRDVKASDYGEIFHLTTAQLAIIKAFTTKNDYLSPTEFVRKLKNLSVPVDSLRPLEEAISSVGGVRVEEMEDDFSLKKYPWIYAFGEMVDWDAPTGGFLLQGCFSMGHFVASSIIKRE